ncbi:MAG: histidinol dehydrogenase, partial [Lentisphaeria bacterium]
MKVIKRNEKDFLSNLDALINRAAFTQDVDLSVKEILTQVKEGGDQALVDLALKFDKAALHKSQLRVTKKEFAEAEQYTSDEKKIAIKTAIQQVRAFSKCRIPKNWTFSPREGVTLGEKFSPIHRVGCYIPGGTAPLISTVVHTVTLAATAGVPEIVVVTPPGKDGKINPVLLYACQQAGATEVYRVGGVYAIGALAYGTESIAKVDKIVGPG